MRLITKLSAFISLLSALAMLLMLVGCALSFFYISNKRIEQRVQILASDIDLALISQPVSDIKPWLYHVMPLLNIEHIEIYHTQRKLLSLRRRQPTLTGNELNRFRQADISLIQHPSMRVRIIWLDPANTWFRSFIGTSTLIAVSIVAAVMTLILLLSHCWLYRQLKGLEHLEQRAEKVISGERATVARGSSHEWPAKASNAIDLLLDDLQEAGEQRIRVDTLIRAFAAQDAKTGLNNRLVFDNQLASLLEDPEKTGIHGAVMIIRIADSSPLDECYPHLVPEDYLFELINIMSSCVMRYPGALLARYFHRDFAILLPHRFLKDAGTIASQLVSAVDALPPSRKLNREDIIHIGISDWHSGQTPQQVMDNAEQATRHSALLGGNNWSVGKAMSNEAARGSLRWRTLLERTLQQEGPGLYQKPALTIDGLVHHRELMPRIYDGTKALLSAEYMPVIIELGLAEHHDRQIITHVISLLQHWPDETVSVPVSSEAMIQRPFQYWLRDTLLQCLKTERKRILFELVETDVCQHINRLQPAFRLLQNLGCRVAVNQAGLTVVSTAYLKQFKAEIIKLHPILIRDIEHRTENQLLIQSLIEICKETPTQVIATGVKTRTEWLKLTELGIAGGLGDFFATSQPVNKEINKYS